MNKDICEYCEIRENGSTYCIGNKIVIVCCGYPSLKKEECLVYQLKTENKKLKGENAKLQYDAEKWRNAFYVKEDALQEAENETEEAENKSKKALNALMEVNKLLKKMKEIDEDEVTVCFFHDNECERCSDKKCMAYWFAKIKNNVSEVLNGLEHN